MLGNSNAKRTRNKKPVWQEGNDYYTRRWRWSHDGNCLKNCRVSFIGLNFKSWTSLEITSHTVLLFFSFGFFYGTQLGPQTQNKTTERVQLTHVRAHLKKEKEETNEPERGNGCGRNKIMGGSTKSFGTLESLDTNTTQKMDSNKKNNTTGRRAAAKRREAKGIFKFWVKKNNNNNKNHHFVPVKERQLPKKSSVVQ